MIKDLDAFSGEAARHGVPDPLAEAVIASLRTAAAEEGDKCGCDQGHSARWNGRPA